MHNDTSHHILLRHCILTFHDNYTRIFKNLFNDISGNKRQGSHAELPKEENLDVEVDIYITELSALLKLIQVRELSTFRYCQMY